jgi:hypothetical protein
VRESSGVCHSYEVAQVPQLQALRSHAGRTGLTESSMTILQFDEDLDDVRFQCSKSAAARLSEIGTRDVDGSGGGYR